MTSFATPGRNPEDTMPRELAALSRLEGTPNTLRIRIAGLAPDQIYRGTSDDLSIAEQVALGVERERVYFQGFQQALAGEQPELTEPQPMPTFLDREFQDDLAAFFDLRRMTLDVVRALSAEEWERTVQLTGVGRATLRDLAVRLEQHDHRMLDSLSRQRQHWLRTTGVDEIRDAGVAGKLSPNIGS